MKVKIEKKGMRRWRKRKERIIVEKENKKKRRRKEDNDVKEWQLRK